MAKEIIENLPNFRRDNIVNILSNVQANIKQSTEMNKQIKPPESEWLGPYIDNCKDIHGKDLQSIWSKILTGKINGTQNTSVRTMSVLSKINSSEAKLFNHFLKYKIENFIYYKEAQMPKDFPTFNDISLLLEIGLVKQMNNIVTIIKSQIPNQKIGILGRYYGHLLFVYFKTEKEELKIPSVHLSKAGEELAQFIAHQRDNKYLSCLSAFLKSHKLQLKSISLDEKQSLPLHTLSNGEDIN